MRQCELYRLRKLENTVLALFCSSYTLEAIYLLPMLFLPPSENYNNKMIHGVSHTQRHGVCPWAIFPTSPSPCSQENLGYFTLKCLWVIVHSNLQAQWAPNNRELFLCWWMQLPSPRPRSEDLTQSDAKSPRELLPWHAKGTCWVCRARVSLQESYTKAANTTLSLILLCR